MKPKLKEKAPVVLPATAKALKATPQLEEILRRQDRHRLRRAPDEPRGLNATPELEEIMRRKEQGS